MRKGIKLILLLLSVILVLSGCSLNVPDSPISRKKSSEYFYTDLLFKAFNSKSSCSINIYETNIHREKELSKEGVDNVTGFFKHIDTKSFIKQPSDLPKKPEYKIFITFNGEKYVINVFNEKYISVHPWDGVYEPDFIEMTNTYAMYNLHGLCRYFFK